MVNAFEFTLINSFAYKHQQNDFNYDCRIVCTHCTLHNEWRASCARNNGLVGTEQQLNSVSMQMKECVFQSMPFFSMPEI